MNILLAVAEINPFSKGGGMADVTSCLCQDWSEMGHEVVAVMPAYKSIDKSEFGLVKTDVKFDVTMGYRKEEAVVYHGKFPNSNANIYLIGHDEYFDEDYIYGDRSEDDDDDRRFLFFSKATLELCKAINFSPDIVNCHDYHTAFIIAFLKTQYKDEAIFSKTGSVFTVHNLSYQGVYDKYRIMDFTGFKIKEFDTGSWFEHEGSVNFMKTGLMYADQIITVSPRYSEEIRQPYYSEGMQEAINSRLRDIRGILNGISYRIWNPATDVFISDKYDADSLETKNKLKTEFYKRFKIPEEKHKLPLISIVSRLNEQKGFDILENKITKLLKKDKFVLSVLGEGVERYEDLFMVAKNEFPSNVILQLNHSEREAHKVIAASDFVLMPSKYEPCGLTQMYALRYGTIPIVRATGGLADTVIDYSTEKETGNGIAFPHYNRDELEMSVLRAIDLYKSDYHIEKMRRNGMAENHSSLKMAKSYVEVFIEILDNL